jgi:5'-methylthioadenosine phosphorylase
MAGAVDVAIIGGTGIGERLAAVPGSPLFVPTEAGMLRGRLVEHAGVRLFAVQRHSAGHSRPPHRVNYAAIALGVKALGARACLSTAAVGSLRPQWMPGQLVACSGFLDFTGRNLTLFDQTVVHRDFSTLAGPARAALIAAADGEGPGIADGGIYLCANGPRYETPEEIRLYRSFGADVVGMTAASEAILMREALVDYACLAIVTNLAAGISPTPLDHSEVVTQMRESGDAAVRILLAAARMIGGST